MPFLIAIVAAVVRILRKPLDARLKKRQIGPLAIAAAGVVLALIWDWTRPPGFDLAYLVGDVAGVLGVYLMVIVLVLATRLVWLEQWFGGLDRMYFWHRRAALWSIPLIALHVYGTQNGTHHANGPDTGPGTAEILGIISAVLLLVLILISIPRVGRIIRLRYDRWLFIHRLTGLFVLVALVHGWLLDPVIRASLVARTAFVLVAGVGLVAYTYDELIRRRVEAEAPYVVSALTRLTPEILDIRLTPVEPDAVLPIVAGQFVYLAIGAEHAYREHPFSVAGVGEDGSVRLTVRALGRDTKRLHAELREGTPATLTGPYGMFDFTVGGPRQIWIAGGIGIAPFLGWISRSPTSNIEIDLFYTAPSNADMPFTAELAERAQSLPRVHLHPHLSRTQGHLTIGKICAELGSIDPHAHVFMCGPARMVAAFKRDLQRLGLPREHIHAEHFAFR